MTRVNLLPWREQRRHEQDRQLLALGVIAAVTSALLVVFAYLHFGALIEDQTARNAFLSEEIAKVEKEIREIADIRKKRDALVARMKVIQQLQATRTQIVHNFDDLVRRVPEGMYLTSMKQVAKKFSFQGVGQSNARVSAFMRNFEESNWFVTPELEVVKVEASKTTGDRVSQFTLHVQQANKAEAAAEQENQQAEAGSKQKVKGKGKAVKQGGQP